MARYRLSLLIELAMLVGCLLLLPMGRPSRQRVLLGQPQPSDESWEQHPALVEPDGQSHRGDRMVAAEIDDPRVLAELSRRFQATKSLQFVAGENRPEVRGAEDFEKRQEYLLRLLDYYHFSEDRLKGKTRAEVERIFGLETASRLPNTLEWTGGRDTFVVYFNGDRVVDTQYIMGY